MLTKFKSDRRAVTALEYAIIAALVSVVIVGSLTTLGTTLSTTFSNVANAL